MALFTKRTPPPAPEPAARGDAGAPADAGEPLPHDPDLEAAIGRIGGDLIERSRRRRPGMLSAAFWSDKLMDWAMKDDAFKVQLFRFVDTYPRLHTPDEVHEHLVDYLSQPGVTLPPGLGVGLKAGGLLKGTMTRTIAGQIASMAGKFMAGTDAASARPVLETLWERGVAFSVDLLGEACVSAAEAEVYQQRYLDLVRELPAAVAGWPARERLESDHLGPVPRANVSIKISALRGQPDPIDTEGAIRGLREALRPILEAARAHGVLINFDMEQAEIKDLTLELFMACCEEIDFPAGLALQAYLRSGDEDAGRIIEWARRTRRQVTVRLVKGAYWDYETIRAEAMGWPIPVWSRKADTDACFERMTRALLEAMPRDAGAGGVKLALGSHNARSIAHALALLERLGLPSSAIELQMLHGMAEQLKAAAVELGLRVREYVPVGEMISGMAYLVRRLLENTSNESWLRAGFAENVPVAELLASPHRRFAGPDPGVEAIRGAPARHRLTAAVPGVGDGRPFMNEPYRDFAQRSTREAFARGIAGARPPEVAADATEADAERALAAAHAAFSRWRAVPARERAAVLVEAARIMRERRNELAGMIICVAGKVWREADAEVCDAIDSCEHYARQAPALFEPRRLGRFTGELNQIVHEPRGVAVVITPCGAPLATLCGWTAAALVTGHTAIMKPAGAAAALGRVLHETLLAAGCPDDAVQLVPGRGAAVGPRLVRDPRTALVLFAGSQKVGADVTAAAAEPAAGRLHLPHLIAEMGGKSAIVVDASADLDEAVLGVKRAAFAAQGQRSLACGRAIVVASTYDAFLDRLCESTRGLRIGDPLDPSVAFGPVIDRSAYDAIHTQIEIGKSEARLALAVDLPDRAALAPGRDYVAPHVFAEVPPAARIAVEEVFGPVLSVIRAESFDEALAIASAADSPRLGAGVYSRKPSHIERARTELRVGCLFINRPVTSGRVGRQPTGGLGLSGTGVQAGAPDTLLHLVAARTVCENTMRRGFAPEEGLRD